MRDDLFFICPDSPKRVFAALRDGVRAGREQGTFCYTEAWASGMT